MEKVKYLKELEFCIKLWKEEGGCTFGGGTKCMNCAAPYLLLKLISNEVLHGDMERLTVKDWEEILNRLKEGN
jgi:hypothetical protein